VPVESKRLTKDGRVIDVLTSHSPIRDSAGNVGGASVILHDITERKGAEVALREQEEFFRLIAENIGDFIAVLDRDGRRLYTSPSYRRFFGDTTDLRGTDSFAQIHPEDRQRVKQVFTETVQSGIGRQIEYRLVLEGGEIRHMESRSEVIRDEQDRVARVVVVSRDVTERKLAEEAIARERALLRTIIDTVPEYIYVKDAQGRFLLANQSWLRARDIADDNVAGKTVFDFFSRDVAEKMAAQDADVIKTGVPMPEWEQRIILNTSGGKQVENQWGATTKVPMRDPSGNIIGTVGVSRDITERKQAAEALRVSEERFRATFEGAPVGIMQTGVADGRILQTNPKLSEMLGYSRDELLGMKTHDIVHPDQVGIDRPQYREQMLSGELESYESEVRYLRKDGSVLWANRIVSLVKDAAGQPLYFIRIIADITERKMFSQRMAMEHAVTQVLAESASVEEAMRNVLRTICQALDWTCGAYWKWNETDQLLRCAETWYAGPESVAAFVAASLEHPNEAPAWIDGTAPGISTGGVVRRVWFSGMPAWIPDLLQMPDFRRGPAASEAGLHSAFGFPIFAGAQPLGVMEFYGSEIKQPDEALLKMVEAISRQIGQFIQRKEAEGKLAFLARFDTVTGLPNRFLFIDRLGQILAQSQRNNRSLGVLFVDLDRFKAVNDTIWSCRRRQAAARGGDAHGAVHPQR